MPPDPPTSPPSCKYAPPSLLSDPHINRVARRWMDSKAYSRIGRTKTQLKSVVIATGSLDPNVLLIRPNNRLSFEFLVRVVTPGVFHHQMKHLDREVRQKFSAVRRVVFSTLSVSVSSVDLRLMFDIYIYIYIYIYSRWL